MPRPNGSGCRGMGRSNSISLGRRTTESAPWLWDSGDAYEHIERLDHSEIVLKMGVAALAKNGSLAAPCSRKIIGSPPLGSIRELGPSRPA